MGLTVADVNPRSTDLFGLHKVRFVTVAFDSSYPTGGESLTAANLGLAGIVHVQAGSAGGYVFEYDHTNKKLKAFMGDNNNAADGPLIEVADTTDLSAVTCRAVVYGY